MRFRHFGCALFACSLSLGYLITPYNTNDGGDSELESLQNEADGFSPSVDQTNTFGIIDQLADSSTANQFDETSAISQPDESSVNAQPEDLSHSLYFSSEPVQTIQVQDEFSGGLRELSYYTAPDGSAIINGDIVWGSEQELLAHQVNDNTDSPLQTRAFSIPAGTGWPNAEIMYKYDSDDGEAIISDLFKRTIDVWRGKAPYLKFSQISPNSAQPKKDVLTIHTQPCGGASATVGHTGAPELKMLLQRSCNRRRAPYSGQPPLKYVVHEMGHVLGLQHEHQRPDRNKYIRYRCENLDPWCNTMPARITCCDTDIPKECCTTKHDFNIVRTPGGDYTGPYDFQSIMQYPGNLLALPGKNTLVSIVPGESIPGDIPSTPTAMDLDRVCKIYAGQCGASKGS